MKILFWNVDTQKDFMNKDGKLYVQGAEEILPNLKKLTDYAKQHNIPVVNTGDYHTTSSIELSEEPDFKTTFPRHCMVGTSGLEFVEETYPPSRDKSYYTVNYTDKELTPAIKRAQNIVIYKDAFDVFAGNPHTENILKALQPDLVIVYGVATNVCVNFAVLGLQKRKIKTLVVEDAIKGLPNLPLDPIFEEWDKQSVIRVITHDVLENIKRLL